MGTEYHQRADLRVSRPWQARPQYPGLSSSEWVVCDATGCPFAFFLNREDALAIASIHPPEQVTHEQE